MRYRGHKGLVGLGLDGWRYRAEAAPRGDAASGAVAEAHPLCMWPPQPKNSPLYTLALNG
jgi:hypothetical protein